MGNVKGQHLGRGPREEEKTGIPVDAGDQPPPRQCFSSFAHSSPWCQPLSHRGQLVTLESQPKPSRALESQGTAAASEEAVPGSRVTRKQLVAVPSGG